MVFDGMVPVLMQTPPTTARDSMTATRFFILEAATAARWPEGPEPITTKSYLAALIEVSPRRGPVLGPHPEATIATCGGAGHLRWGQLALAPPEVRAIPPIHDEAVDGWGTPDLMESHSRFVASQVPKGEAPVAPDVCGAMRTSESEF